MHTLLLLAALGNQLTIDTQQQGNIYTIVPVATLTQDCQCRVKLTALSSGASGQTNSSQSNNVFIKGNEPTKLSHMSLTLTPGDHVTISVSVTDGKDIHLEKQWSSPGSV
ncbi:curli assembly chaperone CsgC [Buttiauxella sp. WJP83]|uniref:curli assembly chaperone CsgC n=1 Tax=Buttiauxella sp. WJP83 TaxID=2986951 RepID=UPI0022DD9DC5|nr:curli assembly chaperone CsgC [Buttiauxella sp. WJP83]WBM69268.1 curli assembly chaperone CsgC [Buttiauxella sp. WJP83]